MGELTKVKPADERFPELPNLASPWPAIRIAQRWQWRMGDRVRKKKGASWHGRVVGFYSTAMTPAGYCVESEREPGSVQLYPEVALELVPEDNRDER